MQIIYNVCIVMTITFIFLNNANAGIQDLSGFPLKYLNYNDRQCSSLKIRTTSRNGIIVFLEKLYSLDCIFTTHFSPFNALLQLYILRGVEEKS